MNLPESPYIILGCGYVGTRLAQALLRDTVPVRACARRVALLEPLRALGADVHYLDGGRPRQFGPVLRGYDRPVVVYSIPGVSGLPAGEAVRQAADAALQIHARAFIYLGTTGVYGRNELMDNAEWVDEDSSVDINDGDMAPRLGDEAALASVKMAGLRTISLRLAAIYGPALWPGQPGRGVRERLRRGDYKLWDGGRYYFSRIHVDDLVRIVRACADRAPAGAMYVVGDDHPCPQGEYGRWLAKHMGCEPPVMDSRAPGLGRVMIRGRRIRNRRLKEELGLTLVYPSYCEGEAQIDAEEQGAADDQGAALEQGATLAQSDGAGPGAVVEKGAIGLEARDASEVAQLTFGADIGAQLGLSPLGATLRALGPGEHLTIVGRAVVLLGAPSLGGRVLAPLDVLPPGTSVHNPGAVAVWLLEVGGEP